MKKFLLIISIACCLLPDAFTQKYYLKANFGAALPLASQKYINMPSDNESDAVNVSFGKGMNLGAAFGYVLNKNFSAELQVNYLLGVNTSLNTFAAQSSGNAENIYTTKLKGNSLSITPSLVFETELGKFNPYVRMGLMLALPSFNISENKDTVRVTKYKGGLAPGLNSALGLSYKLNSKIALFGEFNFISLSYAPIKSEITSLEKNGKDILYNLSTWERQAEYSNMLTIDNSSSAVTDLNQPRQELKQKYPFSSMGINIGIKYNF